MEGCTDGTLFSTGQKYFSCISGRGIYLPLTNLQPDIRFMNPALNMVGDNLRNRKYIVYGIACRCMNLC